MARKKRSRLHGLGGTKGQHEEAFMLWHTGASEEFNDAMEALDEGDCRSARSSLYKGLAAKGGATAEYQNLQEYGKVAKYEGDALRMVVREAKEAITAVDRACPTGKAKSKLAGIGRVSKRRRARR